MGTYSRSGTTKYAAYKETLGGGTHAFPPLRSLTLLTFRSDVPKVRVLYPDIHAVNTITANGAVGLLSDQPQGAS